LLSPKRVSLHVCDLLRFLQTQLNSLQKKTPGSIRHLETDAAIQGVSGWQPTYLHEAVDRIEGKVKVAEYCAIQVENRTDVRLPPWLGRLQPDSLATGPNTLSSMYNPCCTNEWKCIGGRSYAEILRHHFQVALQTRQVMNLPSKSTVRPFGARRRETVYQGLAVDVIESTAVVMSSAAWCQVHRDVITETLLEVLPDGTTWFWNYGESARRVRS
jgi:hypothetical protein